VQLIDAIDVAFSGAENDATKKTVFATPCDKVELVKARGCLVLILTALLLLFIHY